MNTQPSEPIVRTSGDEIELQGEPFLTIQGEGPYAGIPAVFIRTAGCQLDCPGCDTDYTSKRNFWKVESVIAAINRMDLGRKSGRGMDVVGLAVITGGEPFRQPIWKFVTALIHAGFKVQIETNGAAFAGDTVPSVPILSIICSPKTPNIHPAIEPFITAYKYVLDWQHVDPRDGLPSTSLMNQGRVYRPKDIDRYLMRDMIYVQPMDTGDPDRNRMNMQAAIRSCLQFGYRLSVQTHKIVGLP